MWRLLENIRASGNPWLKAATALAVLCVFATFALSARAVLSAAALQGRMDRSFALESAQQRLVTQLSQRQGQYLEDSLNALLQQGEYGFRYLALRGADGAVLAAHGRYESLNRNTLLSPKLRRWLRNNLYTRFGETGLLTLRDGETTVGSLEYAIGSPSARLVRDEAVDRLRTTGWVGGTLALLFAAAMLLLLRASQLGVAMPGALRERSLGKVTPPHVSGAIAPGVVEALPAALDSLHVGAIDLDGELRVLSLNDTAATLTGWTVADAKGQLIYTVFHSRDEAGAPIPSPGERCVREAAEQPPTELRLRPRAGSGRDVMVEARAVPLKAIHGGARMVFQDISGRVGDREQLRTQARIAEGVIDHLLEAVMTTDLAGVVKSANARALRMFGYGTDEMQRMTIARLLPVPFMNTPGLKLSDYMPGGGNRLPKLAGWRKDATTFPAELVVEPMDSGGERRLVVIVRDITEQMRSQSLAQRLGRLLDSASEEVYIFDAQSLYFTEVNKGARKNLAMKPDQLARMNLAAIATDLEPAMLQSYLARLRGGEVEHITYKATHRRSDGTTYPVEVRLSFSRDEEPPVYMAIALDITEREAAEKRMRQLAHYDALTNLPNRTLLFDRLKQAMHVGVRSGRQLAVLFMDLDGFKPVNDTYGHEAGDSVLQAIADRLNAGLRIADTVARFGGDEFVVLAMGIRDIDDAQTLAGKVHDLFKVPFDVRGEKVRLSASIGITLYPADRADAEGLLRHADAAMYQAKQIGQGHTRLYELPDSAGIEAKPKPQRADLAREIHFGLSSAQFQLQFLPVMNGNGELAAAMADFYWMHPEFGRVDSHDTLHAARRVGLNAEIEHWLLRQSARQYPQSRQQGLSALPLLLPLTGRQWRDPEFAERLETIMSEADAPLGLLIPVLDGSDWIDAVGSMQMLWPRLMQHGLRVAVRDPDPDGPLHGMALALLSLKADGGEGEALVFSRARRLSGLQQTLLIEDISNASDWEPLRRAGALYGCGPGLQSALTPMEFASWSASRKIRPL